MAKKIILHLAALALFALLANATTVEVEVEDDDNQQFGRCRREFQQHQRLRACQIFMRRRAHRGGQWAADEFELEVEGDDNNEEDENQRGRPPVLRQCCNQLRRVDRPCICPVLRQAAHQQLYQGQVQGPYQVRRLFRAARNLPNICNIPVGQCPFGAW